MKNGVFLENGVYPEESGHIGSKKKKKRKKRDNSAHLYIDLLSAICENSFREEINPTKIGLESINRKYCQATIILPFTQRA